MCDKLVFDLSQEIDETPTVFVRKDWINILDNQNGNYQSNQSIIDTSQLSNSNKYMSYREAYFQIPMLLGIGNIMVGTSTPYGSVYAPSQMAFSAGLKNWFGSIIHSFTVDYNGTTIIQQTPFCNMWNIFKLITTLSYSDINILGSTIGFYPDNPNSFSYTPINTAIPPYIISPSANGNGTSNNNIGNFSDNITSLGQQSYSDINEGLIKRICNINYDPQANVTGYLGTVCTYSTLLSSNTCNNMWKNYISTKITPGGVGQSGCMQISIMGTVYLKHVHSFFNMIPLIKGAFMKMTINLNNASCSVSTTSYETVGPPLGMSLITIIGAPTVPSGGVNPILIPSTSYAIEGLPVQNPAIGYSPGETIGVSGNWQLQPGNTYIYDLSVGKYPLSTLWASLPSPVSGNSGKLSTSILLYVPAYTFNPIFEQAYLSSPIKEIKYTDIYQYQILNTPPLGNINSLATNGIANIKSVLIIPFFSAIPAIDNTILNTNTGLYVGTPVYQSPFDTAGCGTTSPLCHLTNFNVQISGQNILYNMQRYGFEQFNNQLYGQNSINGGQTDGLSSGLIDYLGFQNSYCYYYVNVERMLPVEQSVPKSVQVLGTNLSNKACDYWVFVEYKTRISIDILTGARV